MIILRDFEIKDWSDIDDAVEPMMPLVPTESFLEMARSRGISVTAVEDGKVMACGGIMYINNDEGMVWTKISKKCLGRSFRWARIIKETFQIMMDSVGDVQISTYILDNFCKGEKVARLIGLKLTEEAHVYNGNTYHIFKAVV